MCACQKFSARGQCIQHACRCICQTEIESHIARVCTKAIHIGLPSLTHALKQTQIRYAVKICSPLAHGLSFQYLQQVWLPDLASHGVASIQEAERPVGARLGLDPEEGLVEQASAVRRHHTYPRSADLGSIGDHLVLPED